MNSKLLRSINLLGTLSLLAAVGLGAYYLLAGKFSGRDWFVGRRVLGVGACLDLFLHRNELRNGERGVDGEK